MDPRNSVHKPHNSLAHPQKNLRQSQDASAENNPKSFADLRLKLGEKRGSQQGDNESVPSEISQDEWVEIVKYRRAQFEEDQRREQAAFLSKKQQLRDVLDRQMRDQRSVRERESKEKRDFDADLLGRMRAKEEQEKAKQREVKNKIYQQKQMND